MSKPELRWSDDFVSGIIKARDERDLVHYVIECHITPCSMTFVPLTIRGQQIDNWLDDIEAAKAACERHWQGEAT